MIARLGKRKAVMHYWQCYNERRPTNFPHIVHWLTNGVMTVRTDDHEHPSILRVSQNSYIGAHRKTPLSFSLVVENYVQQYCDHSGTLFVLLSFWLSHSLMWSQPPHSLKLSTWHMLVTPFLTHVHIMALILTLKPRILSFLWISHKLVPFELEDRSSHHLFFTDYFRPRDFTHVYFKNRFVKSQVRQKYLGYSEAHGVLYLT